MSKHPLREWLEKNERTQQWLGEQVGVEQPAIARVVNTPGAGFSPPVAIRISQLTGIAIEKLLFNPGNTR